MKSPVVHTESYWSAVESLPGFSYTDLICIQKHIDYYQEKERERNKKKKKG